MTVMINNKLIIILIVMSVVICDAIFRRIENIVLYNIFCWIRPPQTFAFATTSKSRHRCKQDLRTYLLSYVSGCTRVFHARYTDTVSQRDQPVLQKSSVPRLLSLKNSAIMNGAVESVWILG